MSTEFDEEYPILTSHNEITAVVAQRIVPCPSWKRRVVLQEFTGGEMDEFRAPMYQIDGTKIKLSLENNNLRMLAIGIRHENGARMYPNTETGIKLLRQLPSSGIELLAKHQRELNGDDDDDKKIEGNSEGERTADSSSASPSLSVAPSVSLATE